MTEKRYFIGVDGGGSFSKAVLVDQTLKVLSHAQGDSLNYYSIGFAQAKANFSRLIQALLEGHENKTIHTVFIGMSAIDGEKNGSLLDSFIDGVVQPEHIYMQSDLYVALMGLTLGKAGLMLVAGTGSMAIALDDRENELCLGGYGYLVGDQGSAYSIASQAIREALLAFDALSPPTSLQEAMLLHFGVDNHRDVIEQLYTADNPRKRIASFAVKVALEAAHGDSAAGSILEENAQYLAKLASSLIRKADIRNLDTIGIYGGVFEHNSEVRRIFRALLLQEFPSLHVRFPAYPPELGAAIAAIYRFNHLETVHFNRLANDQQEEIQ